MRLWWPRHFYILLVARRERPQWLLSLFCSKFWEIVGTYQWYIIILWMKVEWWGHSAVVGTLKTDGNPWTLPVVITVRNVVMARLYFHRHLWFCSQGGWGGRHPTGQTPSRQIPPGQKPPEQIPPRTVRILLEFILVKLVLNFLHSAVMEWWWIENTILTPTRVLTSHLVKLSLPDI